MCCSLNVVGYAFMCEIVPCFEVDKVLYCIIKSLFIFVIFLIVNIATFCFNLVFQYFPFYQNVRRDAKMLAFTSNDFCGIKWLFATSFTNVYDWFSHSDLLLWQIGWALYDRCAVTPRSQRAHIALNLSFYRMLHQFLERHSLRNGIHTMLQIPTAVAMLRRFVT